MYNYWDRINRNGLMPYSASAAEMDAQAARITQLAPESVESLVAQARNSLFRREWAKSLAMHKEAYERYPGSVDTNLSYGSDLYFSGHREQGLHIMEAGAALDPLSLDALTRLSFIHMQSGKCSEVQRLAERALEIEPGMSRMRGYMGYCLLIKGDSADEALNWLAREPLGFIRNSGNAIALNRLGRQPDAVKQVEILMADSGDPAAYQFAQIYAQWGDTRQALDWLRKAIDLRDPGVLNLRIDSFIDPIRQEAEFQSMLVELGLGEK